MSRIAERERDRQQLRLRIERLRRRIGGRLWAVERRGRRLLSWRTYVRRYPALCLAAAMGLGLAASAGFRAAWTRYVGMQLARRGTQKIVDLVWQELKQVWADSAPDAGLSDTEGGGDA